jgi:GT2 family glycosyltransferase
MSYRVACLGDLRFDDRLHGYSWGEDFDFSYRLSRRSPLTISRRAECHHDESPTNRMSAQQVALVRTVLLHAWVREHRHLGLRLSAYWWSLVGEMSLRALDAVVSRDAVAARTALGIALGAWHVMRHGSSRSFTG